MLKTDRVNVIIDIKLKKQIKIYCAENNISITKFIIDAVNKKLRS